jgi:hypothetical protein
VPIPDVVEVVVLREKVVAFLLDPNNPANKGRAQLFRRLGYSVDDWELLAEDLRKMALELDAIEVASPYGRRYRVVGVLEGPDGSRPVRTIWEIPHGADAAFFVTAYPRRNL